MSRYSFSNDENSPFLNLSISGEDVRLDWFNCTLFTHLNDTHIDHVFVEREPIEDENRYRAIGYFIFRQVLPDFDDLVNGLITHDFPHMHNPYPNPADVDSYERSGLIKPEVNVAQIIEEAEDADEAMKAMSHWDDEWRYYSDEL